MMNRETDKKFLFVTPFLGEVDRILSACSQRGFRQPDDSGGGGSKLRSISQLIRAGENIATTHELFSRFSDDMIKVIEEVGYTLVLDEVIETLEIVDLNVTNSYYYRFDDTLLDGKLVNVGNSQYVWSFSPSLFKGFKEAYVLTYMFSGQTMKSFFEINGIPYELIGVRLEDGEYAFCPIGEMPRARDYINRIHVLENDKLNSIGNKRSSFSATNVKSRGRSSEELIEKTQKNLRNVFINIFKSRQRDTMWSSYKEIADKIVPHGYKGSFVPFNQRASNKYADRHYLAYCANVFLHPAEAHYYSSRGAPVDTDMYALSVLIQWVFRSAIRKGEDVWIYIPSGRMRYLFKEWLRNIESGDDLKTITYKSGAERMAEKTKPARRGRPKKRGRKKSTSNKK